jgi:CHAD domain-containing protein
MTTEQTARPAASERQVFSVENAPLGHHVCEQLLARLRQTERLFTDSVIPHDVAVHQARKNMKRVRAILRLKADAADVDTLEQQRRCQRIGQQLSELRDADVMLLTLRKVALKAGPRLPRRLIVGLERQLESRRAALLDAGAFDSRTVRALRADLAWVIRGVETRPIPVLTESDLIEAVRRSRCKGQAAWRALGSRPSDGALHGLRKRAKREFYQRELLEGVVAMDRRRQERLDTLCDTLGWHQDLVVLLRVAAELDSLLPELVAELRRQRRNCRRRARRQGAHLYG